MTADFFTDMGYTAVRQLPDGRWIGVMRYIYTAGRCVDMDETGIAYRYCYERYIDAVRDAERWDGIGDPPGPWMKLKGHPERGDVMGPGWKGVSWLTRWTVNSHSYSTTMCGPMGWS